jgi:hypothetical protein
MTCDKARPAPALLRARSGISSAGSVIGGMMMIIRVIMIRIVAIMIIIVILIIIVAIMITIVMKTMVATDAATASCTTTSTSILAGRSTATDLAAPRSR